MKKEPEIPEGYLRVTQVLTPFSKLEGIDPAIVLKAGDRGSRVHSFCEAHALGLFIEECDADCKNYVEVFKKWFDSMVMKVHHTEVRLNSPTFKISGAFDMIATLKGDTEPTLIDIKTPATHSQAWALQTAAYQMLADELLKVQVARRICLMLPKYGDSVKIVEYSDHANDLALYLKALELYRFFNPNIIRNKSFTVSP
jgi:hypothetical protein